MNSRQNLVLDYIVVIVFFFGGGFIPGDGRVVEREGSGSGSLTFEIGGRRRRVGIVAVEVRSGAFGMHEGRRRRRRRWISGIGICSGLRWGK